MTAASGVPLVLIVDADPDSRVILASFLEHAGYEVTQAGDADAAATVARQRSPAVIVGEHPIRTADGVPLCEMLRSDPATAHIPFLAVTSRVVVPDFDEACRNHYRVFAKPADYSAVVKAISTIC
jgi:CheY-like chemotaxis protein